MNTTYDVIVLGTGLKECMLAGLLAKFPKKTPGEEKKKEPKFFNWTEMVTMVLIQPP